ncbi:hypothetical protein NC99_00430 [Sunxiuqinia dokdonensis]|uniref:Uncharacterized protein n=1 Tax=Sunxiuqinia dokdonensis TaxID=1409788 RepID=A0A0L8VFM7_9BACT|nr:hypothetical protein NC99_00430 [Sunxiuqinia dokdonensis]
MLQAAKTASSTINSACFMAPVLFGYTNKACRLFIRRKIQKFSWSIKTSLEW